jgi:hypothetical protein
MRFDQVALEQGCSSHVLDADESMSLWSPDEFYPEEALSAAKKNSDEK